MPVPVQTWDAATEEAPAALGGPFGTVLAANAVTASGDMAGACPSLPLSSITISMPGSARILSKNAQWKGLLVAWHLTSCWLALFTPLDARCLRAATLGNIASAIAPGGFLILQELAGALPAALFGLDAARWSYADERASGGPWVAKPQWRSLLASAGLTQIIEHWRAPRSLVACRLTASYTVHACRFDPSAACTGHAVTSASCVGR